MTENINEREVAGLDRKALFAESMKSLRAYPSTVFTLLSSPTKFFASPRFEEPVQCRLTQSTSFLFLTVLISSATEYFLVCGLPLNESLPEVVHHLFRDIGMNYVFAVAMHFALRLFRSKSDFIDTFVAANYASVPLLIVGVGNLLQAAIMALFTPSASGESTGHWLATSCLSPGITYSSFLVPLYGCFIFIRGITELNKMSRAATSAASIAVLSTVIAFFLPPLVCAVIVASAIGIMTAR